MKSIRRRWPQWVILVAGPILGLISFVVAYFIDPLNFGGRSPLAAVPASLLAVVVLLISHNVVAYQELERASLHSDRIYEAVKDYLHVTKVGSPETAIEYVETRLPILREVRNTSFTLPVEEERSGENFYDTDAYVRASRQLALHVARGLRWKDIGDQLAVTRLRSTAQRVAEAAGKHKSYYQYRLIAHSEPQINFILLTYPDGSTEVLFNWDFRNIGPDPVVLLSRDRDIVEMFAVQFEHLWRAASLDHDSTAVRSTSTM